MAVCVLSRSSALVPLFTGVLLASLLAGCDEESCGQGTDADGDGYCADVDCDDSHPGIYPGAEEVCDGLDSDCDGEQPEHELTDDDLDGTPVCADCDDLDPVRYPGATETCNLLDDDCDGELGQLELDGDGDGFIACHDCNDDNPEVFVGAEEVCDNEDSNCDGVLPAHETDEDGDGYTECDGDCNPGVASIFPGAFEQCDAEDTDCDGSIPEDEVDEDLDGWLACGPDCNDQDAEFGPHAEEVCDGYDNDCDGAYFFDEETGTGELTDVDGDGWTPCGGDCDDQDETVNPNAYELYNNLRDDDCNGQPDDSPNFSPLDDDPSLLLEMMEIVCAEHLRSPVHLDFEGGVVDTAVASELPGVEVAAGELEYLFTEASSSQPAAGGSYYVRPESPGQPLTLSFTSAQTMILFSVSGVDPAQSTSYVAEYFWTGQSQISGPLFGTANPASVGWNFRGLFSNINMAFDQVVFYPETAQEALLLDDLWLCE